MKINNLSIFRKVLKRHLLMFVALLLCTFAANAQDINVQGTVTGSEDNMPIPGVNVLVQGTNKGTITDFDGQYSVKAKSGDILVFSYLGMVDEYIKVTGSQHNVAMTVDVEDLDEVVVIGYGTVKKKELTGAVAQVKADDIQEFITTDVASALQGQIAGVNVTAASGEPGENASIQIRGVTSLTGTNTPLFVVDGIPQQGDPGLTPNEIETIDILKDAASAAVYGTRGAGGVILITTKQGKEGKMNVTFDTSYGIQNLAKTVPLMNTQEKLFFEVQRYNYTPWNFTPGPFRNPEWLNNDNDFSDYVLNNSADVKRHNLNISGSNGDFSYNVVGGFFKQEGALINSSFTRYNGRASTSYKTDKWKIDASLATTINNRVISSSGLIVNAIRYPSYYPIVDPDADEVFTNGSGGVTTPLNILATALKKRDNFKTDRMNASLSIRRELTDDISFTTRLGSSVTNGLRNQFVPPYRVTNIEDGTSEIDPTKSYVQAYSSRETTLSWDGSLNYKKKFGNHNVGALASMALDENAREEFTAYKQGVSNSDVQVLNGATINPDAYSGFNYTTRILGFLGRVQYDYDGKYLLSASVRRDGSSKFGSKYRWGTFPSISAAWNVSDEVFWNSMKSTVNNFKIRASYGTVGNESFPAYEYSSSVIQGSDYIFDENDNIVSFGSAINSFANADVKWETSVSKNIGVDFGFLKNKITLTADYYNTEKEDMIFPVTLPGSAGAYSDPITYLNVGNMTNKGLELGVNYRPKIGKSRLSVGATFTKNDNEITKMAGSNDLIYNGNSTLITGDPNSTTTVLAEGYEVGSFFLYETDGVIQTQEELDEYRQFPSRINAELGDLRYVDYDGDGDITEADRHYAGSGMPDFEVGLNLRWNYKNFDLSMNWYGTVGSEILNGTKAAAYSYANHADLVNMWTPENPTSNIPLWTGDSKSGFPNYVGTTDLWLENGDYIRLKLISLGYTLPKDVSEKIGITNLRIFTTAQNPLTITNYEGYDPEVGGSNVARRGLDVSRYPLTSIYTLGVKLTF